MVTGVTCDDNFNQLLTAMYREKAEKMLPGEKKELWKRVTSIAVQNGIVCCTHKEGSPKYYRLSASLRQHFTCMAQLRLCPHSEAYAVSSSSSSTPLMSEPEQKSVTITHDADQSRRLASGIIQDLDAIPLHKQGEIEIKFSLDQMAIEKLHHVMNCVLASPPSRCKFVTEIMAKHQVMDVIALKPGRYVVLSAGTNTDAMTSVVKEIFTYTTQLLKCLGPLCGFNDKVENSQDIDPGMLKSLNAQDLIDLYELFFYDQDSTNFKSRISKMSQIKQM